MCCPCEAGVLEQVRLFVVEAIKSFFDADKI
jgi:hypothetical protein